VRVIDETGKQLGVLSLQKALKIAQERNVDLIQITEKVIPPVCKLMDHGKYFYQQKKKDRGTKPRGGELKGIRLTFGISAHDLATRVRQAEKFLKKGDKVRIEMKLRGRQKALHKVAEEKIQTFFEMLKKQTTIKVERELKREPRGLTMIIVKE